MRQDELPPQYRLPYLRYAPRIRQILYCDFLNGNGIYPNCAVKPEFWKTGRPVLILSPKAKLDSNVTVLPLTTKQQAFNPACYEMPRLIYGRKASVICNYLMTVSVARLSAPRRVELCPQDDFESILSILKKHLPKIP